MLPVYGQMGCTDPQASNYNATALLNDGSCVYANTTLTTNAVTTLATPLLDECSGLIATNGNVWMHVDDTDNRLFKVDITTGDTLQSTMLQATNIDWEDLGADSNNVYIADIGNNSGNRTNLQFYKAPLLTLLLPLASVQSIAFNYADQVTFTPSLNNTPWDAEAFYINNDSIHLFTKDWVTKYTKHYIIPGIAGNYTATLVDSFYVGGLITSAAIDKAGTIVLLGYDNTITAPCFVWMLYDYKPGRIFSGNKRKFNLGSAINLGQTEGITFTGNGMGYITNERFTQLIINVPPTLRSFDINPYISATSGMSDNIIDNPKIVWSGTQISILHQIESEIPLEVYDMYGKLYARLKIQQGQTQSFDFAATGTYLIVAPFKNIKPLLVVKP